MTDDPRPWLVTLGLDPASFDRLDALRGRYFPPGRNLVPAHVSLFHHLPGDQGPAVRAILDGVAATTAPPPLAFSAPFRLGVGFAVRVESADLGSAQARLARGFAPWLTPQDRQPYRPHATLMNKADRREAARAFAEVRDRWVPWIGAGEALLLWRYLGGPWEPAGRFPFRGEPDPGPG